MAAVISSGTGSLTYGAGFDVTVNLTVVNQSGAAAVFSVSSGLSGSYEVNTVIPGFGVYERTAIAIPGSSTIVCTSPSSSVVFSVYGYTN